MSVAIGQPVDRVDGHAKVTGAGRYSAEIALPNLAHAVLIGAELPSGRVSAIQVRDAERAPGVLAVLTHDNLPRIAEQPPLFPSLFGHAAPGETFFPMQDAVIRYAGQPVAMVIADTLERAQHAATSTPASGRRRCGSRPPSASRPTTTTRSSRRRPPPSGMATS
jgi:xanthine dehydrogenase YagR molybdenum-binding subunit